MQDLYVGDIGDYGKYGMLRVVEQSGLPLAINWYRVVPKTCGKQEDGKYVSYLKDSKKYRYYDPELFDTLHRIVYVEKDRAISRIERSGLINSGYFSDSLEGEREVWHKHALDVTHCAEVVFLDPDNGLETKAMYSDKKATEKHVKWQELKDYYSRGQSVILYQHRPQMEKKEDCIARVLEFNRQYLYADEVYVLEFPKYTNRFYFFFAHQKHAVILKEVCRWMGRKWNGMCNCLSL